jgi:hypothetical protein
LTNGNGKKLQGLDDLMNELNDEVDEETRAALKPADQRLDEVAREILRLERDLTVPGSPSSENVRIERLMNFIEGREF